MEFIVTKQAYHVEEHPCRKILKGSQISPPPAWEIRYNMSHKRVSITKYIISMLSTLKTLSRMWIKECNVCTNLIQIPLPYDAGSFIFFTIKYVNLQTYTATMTSIL